MNEGLTLTFRRPGHQVTIPDITLASKTLVPSMYAWRVIDDYSGSDHQYICFELEENPRDRIRSEQQPRWKTRKLNVGNLDDIIQKGGDALFNLHARANEPRGVDAILDATTQSIHRACKKSMPWLKGPGGKRSVYWWSEEIAEIRRECLKRRREAIYPDKKMLYARISADPSKNCALISFPAQFI